MSNCRICCHSNGMKPWDTKKMHPCDVSKISRKYWNRTIKQQREHEKKSDELLKKELYE